VPLIKQLHSVNTKSDYSSYSTNCGMMKSHFPYHLPYTKLVTLLKFRLVFIQVCTTVVLMFYHSSLILPFQHLHRLLLKCLQLLHLTLIRVPA